MAVTGSYLCCCCLFACVAVSSAVPGSRGLIVIQGPDSIHVDAATTDTLTSSLTTVFLPVVYMVVFAVGLPSNAMAIYVLLFRSKKLHPAAIYMGNMAIADLLFVVWTPLKIAYHLRGNDWGFGEGVCKVMVGFFYSSMYGSILFIACLSFQRYWVCAHPLSQQRKNNKMAVCVSAGIWALVWLASTPLYLYPQTVTLSDPNITTCHDVNVITLENFQSGDAFRDVRLPYYYFMAMAVLAFFVPMLAIVVAYVLLLRALGDSSVEGSAGKSRRRAVVLILTVLVTFLVCFIPSNVMLVVHYALLARGWTNNGYGFYITALCLSSLNSCLDPFIYYYVSDEFREHVRNTLLCRSSRTVERMRVSFSSMKYSKKSKIYTSSTANTESSTC